MKHQIETSLSLLEQDKFDLEKIDLFSIDSDVIRSVKTLFENLFVIRNKMLLQIYLKRFMKQTLGYFERNDYIQIKHKSFRNFLERNFKQICQGDLLIKINFNTNGKVEHFYELSPETKSIKIYKNLNKKRNNSSFKTISFSDIREISFGIHSANLKRRVKSLKNRDMIKPWLYMSILTDRRSIDLYVDSDEKINQWFYGLKHFIYNDKNLSQQIIFPNVNQFIQEKVKSKLIFKLKSDIETNSESSLVKLKPPKVLTDLLSYIQNNDYSFENLSFLKILLLFNKLETQKKESVTIRYT